MARQKKGREGQTHGKDLDKERAGKNALGIYNSINRGSKQAPTWGAA